MPGVNNYLVATIANGASLSGALDLGSEKLFAVQMPASWTAAGLSFSVSTELAGTYTDLYDESGTEVTWTVSASRYVIVSNPSQWMGVRFIKIRSGTTGTPVNQGADRLIRVITVP